MPDTNIIPISYCSGLRSLIVSIFNVKMQKICPHITFYSLSLVASLPLLHTNTHPIQKQLFYATTKKIRTQNLCTLVSSDSTSLLVKHYALPHSIGHFKKINLIVYDRQTQTDRYTDL